MNRKYWLACFFDSCEAMIACLYMCFTAKTFLTKTLNKSLNQMLIFIHSESRRPDLIPGSAIPKTFISKLSCLALGCERVVLPVFQNLGNGFNQQWGVEKDKWTRKKLFLKWTHISIIHLPTSHFFCKLWLTLVR